MSAVGVGVSEVDAQAGLGAARRAPRLSIGAVLVVYQALLAWSYRTAVSPLYDYVGFHSRTAGLVTFVPAFVLGALPALWLPVRPRRPSGVVLWILHVFVVAPSTAIAALVPTRTYWQTIAWSAWLVAALAVASIALVLPVPALPRLRMRPSRARVAGIAVTLLVLGACVARFGVSTSFVSPTAVTERRLAFRAQLGTVSPAFGYLTSWLQSAIAPFLLVAGLVRRSILVLLLGLAALAWSYQVTATRQALVAVPFAAMLYVAGHRKVRGIAYVLFAIVLLAASSVGYQVTRRPIVAGIVGERIFAVPGVLGIDYFDYFAGRPPLLFRDSFAGALSPSPYPGSVPLTIGARYLNEPEGNANVNVFADAFSKLWLAGLMMSVALAVMLLVLDAIATKIDVGPLMACHVLVLLALTNTGLTVTLLTSGWLILLGLLWFSGAALLNSDHSSSLVRTE